MKLKFFRGRKGGVISRLPSGKIVLPARGFNPLPGEEYAVEIEEKERYAIAHPHKHQFYTVINYEQPNVFVFKQCKCGHWELIDKVEDVDDATLLKLIEKYKPVNKDELLKSLKRKTTLKQEYEQKLQHYLEIFKMIPRPPTPEYIIKTKTITGTEEIPELIPEGAKIVRESKVESGEQSAAGWVDYEITVYQWEKTIEYKECTNEEEIEQWASKLSPEQKYAITWLHKYHDADTDNEFALECAIYEQEYDSTQSLVELTAYENSLTLAEAYLEVLNSFS